MTILGSYTFCVISVFKKHPFTHNLSTFNNRLLLHILTIKYAIMNDNLKNEILQRSNYGLYFFELILGYKLQPQSDKRFKNVKNPLYNDKNPSLSICKNNKGIWGFNDYGIVDHFGDVFDFYALHHKLDIKKDFVELLNMMKSDLDNNQILHSTINQASHQSTIDNKNEVIGVNLLEVDSSDTSKKYMSQYGITTEIMKINNVVEITGYKELHLDSSLDKFKNIQNQTFYAYKQDKFAKLYCPNPKKFLYVGKKPKDYIFGLNFNNNSSLLFLVGGEKDVLALHSKGFQAVCLNSETTPPSRRIMKSFYEDKITPIIMYDCDEAGRKGAERISKLTDWKIADLSTIIPIENRENVKDVSDYIRQGLSIDKLKFFLEQFSDEIQNQEESSDTNNEDLEEVDEIEDFDEDDEVKLDYDFISDEIYKKLPSAFQDVSSPIKDRIKKDLVLVASLGVVSNLIDINGIYGNKVVYPNLFIFITAPASSGKGVMSWVRRLGDELQKKYNRIYQIDKAEFEDNKRKGEKPKRLTVFQSANASVSGFIKQLSKNQGKSIVFETEADSLNGVMKNEDWGSFSDLFRRSFEFETISMLRVDEDNSVEIDNPRLSVVLSGTKDQLFKLIPSAENGLYSRFLFMQFPLIPDWQDVFENDVSFDNYYKELSKKFKDYHEKCLNVNIIFTFTTSQKEKFHLHFERIQREYHVLYGDDIIASVRRIANIQFRIAMLLSAVRMLDAGEMKTELICEDVDFDIASDLIVWFLIHTVKIFGQLPNKPKQYYSLKNNVAKLYDNLPEEFTYKGALKIGESLGLPNGTIQKYLRRLREVGLLTSEAFGKYVKKTQKV